MDENYYVEIYWSDEPSVIEVKYAETLDEAYYILETVWKRGPMWDAYIREANDLSASEKGDA